MQMKYSEQAKEKGVFIVSACGWDSIPCDLGMEFLKKNFDGTLTYAETFAKINTGESVSLIYFFIPLLVSKIAILGGCRIASETNPAFLSIRC